MPRKTSFDPDHLVYPSKASRLVPNFFILVVSLLHSLWDPSFFSLRHHSLYYFFFLAGLHEPLMASLATSFQNFPHYLSELMIVIFMTNCSKDVTSCRDVNLLIFNCTSVSAWVVLNHYKMASVVQSF